VDDQVWSTLDEHGIGGVFAAIVAKVSVANGAQPARIRVNPEPSARVIPWHGTTQSQGGSQDESGTKDWNGSMITPHLAALDDQDTTRATAPGTGAV
jgi:hypothetical protein